MTLTGRVRFRIDDNKKLVLQVEWEKYDYILGWTSDWRDAEVQDITAGSKLVIKNGW